MKAASQREIFQLPVSERLQLVEDLWDSIALEAAELPVTREQGDELDKRLRSLKRDRSSGDTWKNVKSRILRK